MISLKPIRENAGAPAYTRGNQVYKRGLVHKLKVENQGGLILVSALVEGSYNNRYQVELVYDRMDDDFLEYSCECEAFAQYQGMCKHCVGTALELLAHEQGSVKGNNVPGQITWSGTKRIRSTDREVLEWIRAQSIREKSHFFQAEVNGKVELIPILHIQPYEGWTVEFKIGAGQNYVVKSISALVEAVHGQDQVEYGKKLKFYHQQEVFTAHSQKVLRFLETCMEEEQQAVRQYRIRNSSYYYHGGQENVTERMLLLGGERMVHFAALYAGQACCLDGEKSKKKIRFVKEDPNLKFKVEETDEGACRMSVPAANAIFGVERLCIHMDDTVYLCSREYSKDMWEMARLLTGKKHSFWINPEDFTAFCAALPSVERRINIKRPECLGQYEPRPCVLKAYLDRQEGQITAALYGEYGEERYNLTEPASAGQAYRDIEKESIAANIIRRYFRTVDLEKGMFVFPEKDEDAVYGLISEGIPVLQQMGEVYISDDLKALRLYRSPRLSVGVSLSGGMLNITLSSERFSPEELAQILSGYKRKKRFYRLKDGSFLTVEDSALAVVAEMAAGLEMDDRELAEGTVRVPEYRAFYLDQLLREQNKDIQVDRNREYRALLREFKNVEDCDFEVPEGLCARLRPYQKFGFRWMCTLDKLGFGGILADDMGLGKTVQAIAFLLAGKPIWMSGNKSGSSERYALVVCPASLVYNWESELRRFAPGLAVTPVVGTAPVREKLIKEAKEEILLTSYDLLKRDVDQYENLHFQYMMIDEAQNIKNHLTQAAKAVKSVPCVRRFALTGTPIENSLSELWSIFDYLMPGILNSYSKFRKNYEQPIVSSQDEQVTGRLRRMIRPFILRRLKGEVLKELPDKLEEVVYSRMEEKQREIYEANTQQLLDSLKKQSTEEFKTGKIEILAALTRLRQLCCDPGLVYENYNGGAAKVDTCMELLKNGAEAGNKILVFSQFTQALDILEKRLRMEKIPFYILTGSTSKEKRAELVAAFNMDDTPVFLISLKAGGTGLNLTSASIVIHFDPWWNMAAQNQATDRAHRIGQKQVVTVYKLIMKDTLEERILRLQERKAQLSDDIIADGSLRDVLATREEFMEILGAE